jgi:CheY-like chemotaxis protein
MTRILVIDDDTGVRETIRQTLDERGYEVITAVNGALGLAAFRDAPPDLAITDIIMPVMEGLQTIRALRCERPEMPIIAMSAGARGARHDLLEIARQSVFGRSSSSPSTRTTSPRSSRAAWRAECGNHTGGRISGR